MSKQRGNRIRFARVATKTEVSEIIQKIHKSEATYYRYETQGVKDIDVLLMLAKVYPCSYLWLAHNVGQPSFELARKLPDTIDSFWLREMIYFYSSILKDENIG